MDSPQRAHEVRVRLAGPKAGTSSPEEIPRIVRLLALAHRWHRLIDSGQIRDQVAIAAATGLTRARVTQIMDLRWIDPVSQTELARTHDFRARHTRSKPNHLYWPNQLWHM